MGVVCLWAVSDVFARPEGAPANDTCATATEAFNGQNLGSNVGSQDDDPNPDGCPTLGGADIWFLYTATDTGSLIIDTCGTSVSKGGINTILAVYEECGGDPLICDAAATSSDGDPPAACRDEDQDGQGNTFDSAVCLQVTAGDTLYIQVVSDGLLFPPQGEIVLNITPLGCPPPVGRCCTEGCLVDTDGNASIDVDDLINVILDWGTDGSANGGDINGSGLVDVDDLVSIILNFGECDPVVCSIVTEAECVALDGLSWDEGASCDDPCPPLLANETCDQATIVDAVPYSDQGFNTLAEPGLPAGSCNTGAADLDNDVWWSFAPEGDCVMLVTVQPEYDGLLSIHEGADCGSLVELDCIDLPDDPIFAAFEGSAGSTYWFQVGDSGSTAGGGLTTFELECVPVGPPGACCLSDGSCVVQSFLDCLQAGGGYQGDGTACGPPANDDCADATAVKALPGTITTSTCCATDDDAAICVVTPPGKGVWYAVTGTGNTMTASTSNPGTDFDTKIQVFCNDCGELICVGGNDDVSDTNLQSTVEWCTSLGQTYYVLVGGFSGACGNLELTIDDGSVCTTPPPCGAPVNDECEDRIAIPANGSATVNNCLASDGADDPPVSCAATDGFGSVFFEFTADDTSMRVRTDLNSVAGDADIVILAVDQGDPCDETLWVEVACSEDDGIGVNADVCAEGLTPGDIYIIMLVSRNEASCGTYTVDISPCKAP
jgi:hypothetical protein